MERRRYKRINASFSFGYRVYKRTDISGDISQIEDISVGGARLITSHELSTDNILELSFRTLHSKKKITLLGKVIECKKDEEKLLYESRISFIFSDTNAHEMIAELIKELNPS